MPSIPQLPVLPAPTSNETLAAYMPRLIVALQRALTTTNYTVNGMIRVDTAANKPAAPDLNEAFYYASDTTTLYVASGGAWVAVTTTTPTDRVAMHFIGTAVGANVTRYLGYDDSGTGAEGDISFRAPVTGNVTEMYTHSQNAPSAGKSYTYTLRVASADTAITHAVTDASTNGNSSGTVAVTKGDRMTVKLVTSTGAAVSDHMVNIQIQATA